MAAATGMSIDTTSGLSAQRGLALARFVIGAMFVWVFFENYSKGLYTASGYAGLIQVYIERGRAPAAWKSVMGLAAANASIAAPLQAVTEFSFGVLLLAGLFTRAIALCACLFLTSLWVSEWGTAWIWELLVPMGTALAVAIGRGGRHLGVDARLARQYPDGLLW
jgi:uncharacterized membrane protein YphA (DoxX/SURF4 family)